MARLISPRDLKRWQEESLLTAFDLSLWGELQGKHYTDAFLGRILWSDPATGDRFIDTTERYRKTTEPLLERVGILDTINRLHYSGAYPALSQRFEWRVRLNTRRLRDLR